MSGAFNTAEFSIFDYITGKLKVLVCGIVGTDQIFAGDAGRVLQPLRVDLARLLHLLAQLKPGDGRRQQQTPSSQHKHHSNLTMYQQSSNDKGLSKLQECTATTYKCVQLQATHVSLMFWSYMVAPG